METFLLSLIKDLLAISIGFVGLIFTSLSILMTLNENNWKIKTFKKSDKFKNFITLNANTAIGFVILFILSIILLSLKELNLFSTNLIYLLYGYSAYLLYLLSKVILIAYRYKQIIILMSDNSKPTTSI
jgi:hypothetical protein